MATQRKKFVETSILREAGNAVGVEWKFPGAQNATRRLLFEDMSAVINAEAMAHGYKQKVGDLSARPDVRTATDMLAQTDAMLARLRGDDGEPTWNQRATGGRVAGDLVEAVARAYDRPVSEAAAIVGKLSTAERRALENVAVIADHMATLARERAAAAAHNAGPLPDLFGDGTDEPDDEEPETA